MLAHVQVQVESLSKNSDCKRKASDELFSDLEMELGEAMVEYARVCLKYSHAAFPGVSSPAARDGVSKSSTTLETVITAAIKHAC